MNWIETSCLERDILLSINRKNNSITEISKDVKRTKSTVSEAVKRLIRQGIVIKTHAYDKDARKAEIQINKERTKIEKLHTFYITYFILTFLPFVICLIFSLITEKYFLLIGCAIGIFPPLLFIIYQSAIKKDKIIVEKNPKIIKKEVEKEPEN